MAEDTNIGEAGRGRELSEVERAAIELVEADKAMESEWRGRKERERVRVAADALRAAVDRMEGENER